MYYILLTIILLIIIYFSINIKKLQNQFNYYISKKKFDCISKDNSKINFNCNNLLHKSDCISTDCCVWLNDIKCVKGNINGPTFIDIDKIKNYYYKNMYFNKLN